jgi:hypothetical protein
VARRETNVLVVLLVLVNLGLLYALLTRHDDSSDGSSRAAEAPFSAVSDHASATASPSRTPSSSTATATVTPSASGSSHHSARPSPHPTPNPSRRPDRSPAPSRTAGAGPSFAVGRLVLDDTSVTAVPFRPFAVTGAWRSAPMDRHPTVRVEMRQGGAWSAFPLPAVVQPSGRFTAYAALGPRGTFKLRVVGSGGGPISDPFVVTVR